MDAERKNTVIGTFFGSRAFYKETAAIVLPIIVQNTVSNVVSLLDNVMVGQVGTLQMSAVAIINQLIFVFNLCIFGGLAGPGIFATQYAGAGDAKGVRSCFQLKAVLALLMSGAAVLVFTLLPEPLIRLYLSESGAAAAPVMGYAKEYLQVMVIGLLPFGLSNAYAMTLRETGETRMPMLASLVSICVNLVFNWLLIFGHLGFPAMGVRGAAIATVLARFVELGVTAGLTHARAGRYPFIRGAYRGWSVPRDLVRRVAVKGTPLLVNEFFWSAGLAAVLACYSLRGIEAVAACNIASTVNNLFNVAFLSLGSAVSIMVGQALGANRPEQAKGLAWKLMATGVLGSIAIGALMFLVAPLVPRIYNTETSVRETASALLRVLAVCMPLFSVSNCCYFTLRSGGRTMITFLFDSVFTWCANYSCARLLCTCTALPVVTVYACVQALEIVKDVLGIVLVKKGIWIRNIVGNE